MATAVSADDMENNRGALRAAEAESVLRENEQRRITEFAAKIDIADTNQMLMYGVRAQEQIADFSDMMLNSARATDADQISVALSSLVLELKAIEFTDREKRNGVFHLFFKKGKKQMDQVKMRYQEAERKVDAITRILEQHQIQLLKDVAMLDELYRLNLQYAKELQIHILAGQKKLEQVRSTDLERLRQKAAAGDSAEDVQAYNHMVYLCDCFEKKLYDLDLSRMVSMQMAPQIRLLQNNDAMVIEKIQSSLVNTIPLWKSQMVLALGMEHTRKAVAAQAAISEMTNAMLRENGERLKQSAVEVARETERGIVDMETLQYTNAQLLTTLDEVMQVQREGAQKRKAAEEAFGRIENQWKTRLAELR